ncbi:hypothetical protein, partial [Escherichia coli]|uniref:hypothetical protein n=1 Tax=Escherichia coli TaxID=562 RepID=UPI002FBE9D18
GNKGARTRLISRLTYFVLPTLCSIINGLDQDGENFIFGVDISYALYHALCRCQRERMNGIFMY